MLNIAQYNILNELKKTSQSVRSLYKKLKYLEKNGQSSSDEFKTTVEYLKELDAKKEIKSK